MTQNNGSYIFRRFFSLVLIVTVFFLTMPAWSFPAAAADTTFAPDSGDGSKDDPWIISSATQLAALAYDVNNNISTYSGKYFKLKDGIQLSGSWTPIGYDSSRSFQGVFDGGDKEIKGLSINVEDSDRPQGLFGYVKSGTVKNLTVSGTLTSTFTTDELKKNGSPIGGIVGRNDGGTIEKCTNNVTVTGAGNRVGGIVGENIGGSIVKCKNVGKITGSGNDYTGGIAGYNENTVKACNNEGSVSGKTYVGGIVGGNNGNSGKNVSTVGGNTKEEGCTNNASVEGNNSVGGVVGRNYSGGKTYNCTNSGTVTGGGNYTGGVAGRNEGSGSIVRSSSNTGTVNGATYAGGVAGHNEGTVEICYNTSGVSSSKSNVGGVVGESSGTVKICYNIGGISGTANNIGGVVGHNAATLQNCYNTGNVDGKGSSVGGIVGANDSAVTNCYNIGTITGGSNVGAALGSNSNSVQNCFYFVRNAELKAIGSGSNSNSVKPATAEEFWTDSTFTSVGWNFSSVWEMGTTIDNVDVRPVLVDIPEYPLQPLPVVTPPSNGDNTDEDDDSGNTDGDDNNDDPPQTPTGGTSKPSTSNKPSGGTDPGDVNVGTESNGSAPDVTISEETSDRLKNEVTEEHLTDEEKTAVKRGDALDIILRVEDAGDTVSAKDRKATEAVLAEIEYTVGQYLNIDLIKLINGIEVGKITETSSPIRITVEIPEELRSADRSYAIVRVHNGKAEILKDADNNPDTITIVTNKFSTYSIAYQDTEPNPNTGITTPIAITALASAVIAAAVAVKKKR